MQPQSRNVLLAAIMWANFKFEASFPTRILARFVFEFLVVAFYKPNVNRNCFHFFLTYKILLIFTKTRISARHRIGR